MSKKKRKKIVGDFYIEDNLDFIEVCGKDIKICEKELKFVNFFCQLSLDKQMLSLSIYLFYVLRLI